MANNRIFYAVHKVGMAPLGGTLLETQGVQSINITTTFNLEQVFELGQLAVYENIEGVPDVEVTMEKVMDGASPLFCNATEGASNPTLVARATQRCHVALAIYDDTNQSATGTERTEVEMSGLYVSTIGYNATVDGSISENITLVGSDKTWRDAASIRFTSDVEFVSNDDVPPDTSVGVSRREDVVFEYTNTAGDLDANGSSSGQGTILPQDIYGISSSGTNDKASDVYGAHIIGFSVNTDLGRESIFELGRKGPYYRYAGFPVEVTSEITAIAVSGDQMSVAEEATNLTDRTIRFQSGGDAFSLHLNMGKKNKLQSLTYSGGDTGGSNVELTYTYSNFNDFIVMHDADVDSALRPASNTGLRDGDTSV